MNNFNEVNSAAEEHLAISLSRIESRERRFAEILFEQFKMRKLRL